LVGWAAKTGQPLLVGDVSQDPRYIVGFLEEVPTRSELSVPLKLAGQVIGVLDVQETQLNAFDETDLTAMETLADQIAVSLKNAQLYEQARQDAETKAMLLREVNHRVKNNLAAIIGMLYIERRHIEQSQPRPTYQVLMEDLINRIEGLATVHRLLSASEWSPLALNDLARQVIRSTLQAVPPGKRLAADVLSIDPIQVTPKQANSLAMVINELATNVVKYALPERQTVRITVRIALENETILFEFRDDGPGFPEEVLGLERQNVGMYLVQNIVHRDLRGEITLHNDKGAVATIRFPERKLSK
jgi:two-component sensor histidine kinase